MKQLWERIQRLKPYRANERYNEVRGNLLSAGIAYYAFFSLFPAFAIAAVVFGFVLRGDPALLDKVAQALDTALPGFVRTANNPEGLITLQAPAVSLLTISGVVALVALVLSAAGWIGSYRDGIRATLGAPGSPGNAVTDRLRDLGVFAALGSGFLVSAALTSVVTAASSWLEDRIGGTAVVVQIAGYLLGYAVDCAILVLLLRVLSGVRLPWPVLRQSALVGGLLLNVVKVFGAVLIANATKNPLLGPVVVVIGLLFWLNLISRIILLTAAWAAVTMQDRGDPVVPIEDDDEDDESDDAADTGAGAREGLSGATDGASRPQHTTVRLIPPATASAGVADPTVSRPRDRAAIVAGVALGAALGAAVTKVVRRAFPD